MDALVIAGIVAAFVVYVAWQRRSPRPFPPWMTPFLHAPWRWRFFSPEVAAERHGLGVGMTVLEVGPADGYLTPGAMDRVTPGGRLVCLDLQLGMLRKLREAMGTRTPPLVCASGSRLPFRSGSFDAVFLAHVLGEIPDRSSALAECARVLRPNGTLAITEGVPDPDFIRQPRLVRMASAAGFRAGKRLGRALHYTQRFHPDKDAAEQALKQSVGSTACVEGKKAFILRLASRPLLSFSLDTRYRDWRHSVDYRFGQVGDGWVGGIRLH